MSVIWTQQQELMQQLYRFAYALCGDSQSAVQALVEALDHVRCNPEAKEHDRAVRKLVLLIRKYCFRVKPPVKKMPSSPALPEDWETRLNNLSTPRVLEIIEELPDPTLTAAALFYATTIPADDIARILGISLRELAEKIHFARRFLAARACEIATPLTAPTNVS